MHTILKFSYFLVFILLLSCGDKTNRQIKNKTTEIVSEPQETPVDANSKVILFFGNSLTAGMGLDPEEAFPAVIKSKLDDLKAIKKKEDDSLKDWEDRIGVLTTKIEEVENSLSK